jgi:hypothetical protein
MINENVENDVMKRLNENKRGTTTQELKEHSRHLLWILRPVDIAFH